MTLKTLNDLFAHMEWADASVWASALAFEAGRTDARLRDLLQHLHTVQRVFLRTWRGEPRDASYPTFEDARAVAEWGRGYYAEAWAFLRAQDDESLSAPLVIPWSATVEERLGRSPGETTITDTALQVVLHSMYHRGQANTRLRELGGEPPLVDYIAWIWLGRPAAEWPASF